MMRNLRSARLLPSALLLLTMCSGCASLGNPPLQVSLSTACESLAQRVPQPAIKAGDNALSVIAAHRIALGLANNRLDATRQCQAKQRQSFAKGR